MTDCGGFSFPVVYTEPITTVGRKADMCLFVLDSYVDVMEADTRAELTMITTKAVSTVVGELIYILHVHRRTY